MDEMRDKKIYINSSHIYWSSFNEFINFRDTNGMILNGYKLLTSLLQTVKLLC